MNQREALKFAANELLEVARSLAAEYAMGEAVTPEEWSDRDVQRVAKGFEVLAARLEYTVTGERAARPAEEDPDQYPLFEES